MNWKGYRDAPPRERLREMGIAVPDGLTRQRVWQILQAALGRCAECNQPRSLGGKHCREHRLAYREYQRRAKGYRAREAGGRGRPTLEQKRGAA